MISVALLGYFDAVTLQLILRCLSTVQTRKSKVSTKAKMGMLEVSVSIDIVRRSSHLHLLGSLLLARAR
jgi:hypothetical protein